MTLEQNALEWNHLKDTIVAQTHLLEKQRRSRSLSIRMTVRCARALFFRLSSQMPSFSGFVRERVLVDRCNGLPISKICTK